MNQKGDEVTDMPEKIGFSFLVLALILTPELSLHLLG